MLLDSFTIGRRVASARVQAGYSQRALAEQLGLTQAQMSRIESGNAKKPDARIIASIAIALGCSTDYLLGLSDTLTVREWAAESAPQRNGHRR